MPFRLGANRIGRLVVGAIPLNIPTDGLYAWWDFNNPSSYTSGSSTVTDLSGNGNNGVVGSVITTALDGSVRYIQGDNATSGDTNSIYLAQDVSTDLATASFVLVVKIPSASEQVWLKGKDDLNSYIAQNATGNFYYANMGTPTVYSNTTVDSTVVEPTDGWKLRTWTGLNLSNAVYVNGFNIGGYQAGWVFEGQVVAALMYNKVLSAGEISQIYTAYDSVIDLDT